MRELLLALAVVESAMNPIAVGDNGKSVGVLQISEAVVIDVNSIYGTSYDWPKDAYDTSASFDIAQFYLEYWVKQSIKKNPSLSKQKDEIAARIWNGGPNGYLKESTEQYWNKVRKEMKK